MDRRTKCHTNYYGYARPNAFFFLLLIFSTIIVFSFTVSIIILLPVPDDELILSRLLKRTRILTLKTLTFCESDQSTVNFRNKHNTGTMKLAILLYFLVVATVYALNIDFNVQQIKPDWEGFKVRINFRLKTIKLIR